MNENAKNDEKKPAFIGFHLPEEIKNAVRDAAEAQGKTVSDLMREYCLNIRIDNMRRLKETYGASVQDSKRDENLITEKQIETLENIYPILGIPLPEGYKMLSKNEAIPLVGDAIRRMNEFCKEGEQIPINPL